VPPSVASTSSGEILLAWLFYPRKVLELVLKIRVARFFLVHNTKRRKYMYNKNTKIPKGHKIHQVALKIPKWS
jgi:hypothetical protein